MSSNANIIVGVAVEKDGKYLLVQESKASCRGKWNLPAGHLDPNETLIEAAKREAREETGCEVEPTSVCQVGNLVMTDGLFISVVFTANLINEGSNYDHDEILDVKWFSYDEILAMRAEIRNQDLLFGAIENSRNGVTAPLELIQIYGA